MKSVGVGAIVFFFRRSIFVQNGEVKIANLFAETATRCFRKDSAKRERERERERGRLVRKKKKMLFDFRLLC